VTAPTKEATLLKILQDGGEASIGAIGRLKIAGSWTENEAGSWHRYPRFDGSLLRTSAPEYGPTDDAEVLGAVLPPEDGDPGWAAFADVLDDADLGTFDSLDEARAEVDAALQQRGWVTP
jgi:hypothetical protein